MLDQTQAQYLGHSLAGPRPVGSGGTRIERHDQDDVGLDGGGSVNRRPRRQDRQQGDQRKSRSEVMHYHALPPRTPALQSAGAGSPRTTGGLQDRASEAQSQGSVAPPRRPPARATRRPESGT